MLLLLRELHISNLAVIEDAAVHFEPGLNVFTGQTGAGKSLVIGAFEVLLGMRSASDMLRAGAAEGRVSGVFEARDPEQAAALTAAVDQRIEPGEAMLMTRKLFASGRSSHSVNAQPATAPMVREVGRLLVDIHGQHDHQYLLRPANQLALLDHHARAGEDRDRFARVHRRLQELQQRREELNASRTLRRQQRELHEFQVREIDQAQPRIGELPELTARHRVLANLRRIQQGAGQAHAALYESEGAIVERLQAVVHVLRDLAELDEGIEPITEQVRGATLSLQEAAFELSRYTDRLEDDPASMEEVTERLNTLNRLAQKYGREMPDDQDPPDDAIAPVMRYRDWLEERLTHLHREEEDLGEIDGQVDRLRGELAALGEKLTAARRRAAKALKPKIEAQLKELGMAEAGFGAEVTPGDTPRATGFDAVEFLVQANPGQPAAPLRKIASGGELSRVMLALKSVLAGGDRISVLVFDEIDANIGGRLGSVIGRKLRDLAGRCDAPSHQVLCITHLPQIAAFADRHYRIAKAVTGKGKTKRTTTTVGVLEDKARVDELAQMMAGEQATPTTREQAREMLAAAR